MKLRLIAIVLTIVVFAAGFGAGVWTESHRPLPPPPFGLLGEFRGHSSGFHLPPHTLPNDPATLAEINAEIERLKPEIDAFRLKLDALNDDFHRRVIPLLTPDQRERFEKMRQRYVEHRAKQVLLPPPSIKSDPHGGARVTMPFFSEPVEGLSSFVIVPLTLDYLGDKLKLDDRQKTAVRRLLLERREKFLALIDSTPPPSIRLSRLAPIISKLVAPPDSPQESPPEAPPSKP